MQKSFKNLELWKFQQKNWFAIVSQYIFELKHFTELLNSRFYKKILGIFFFGDAVYKDIHEEMKKENNDKFWSKS